MAVNVYEGMFLLESGRYGRDPEGVSGQIPAMVSEAGGEMLVSRLWEERRLAYPIRGQRKGTYWLTYFRMDGRRISEIERKCQLSDSVLRAMFIKIDARIVEALVEHAKVGPSAPRREQHGAPSVKSNADSVPASVPAEEVAEEPGDDGSGND